MINPTLKVDRKEFTDGRFDREPRNFAKAGWEFRMRGATEGGHGSPLYVVRGYAVAMGEARRRSGIVEAGPLGSDAQFRAWAVDFVRANKLEEQERGQ
jgi:hypothetical protein